MIKPFSQAFASDRAGISIADFLADETLLSKSKIKQVMAIGGVWRKSVDGEPERIHRSSEKVRLKDEIHIYYDERILKTPPARLIQVADYQQLSVWRKPSTLLLEPHLHCDHLSFSRAIERDLPQSRDLYLMLPDSDFVFGLSLFSHTRVMAASLSEMLEKGSIQAAWQGRCALSCQSSLAEVMPEALFSPDGNHVDFRLSGELNLTSSYVAHILAITKPDENQPFLECTGLVLPDSITGEVLRFGVFEKNITKQ